MPRTTYKKQLTARDYITEKEYEEALWRYYNGLDFDNVIEYKENLADNIVIDASKVEKYLLKGEQYDRLFVNHYVITSFGRAYSLRYDKFLKPKFYNSNVYMYASGKNFTLYSEFAERGWKHDKVEILKHYRDNNWNHVVHENCLYANDI